MHDDQWPPPDGIESKEEGKILVNSDSDDDLSEITDEGHYLTIRKWSPGFRSDEKSIESIATWIRLHVMPLEFYDKFVLAKINNKLGRVLKNDRNTTQAISGRFARLCVEIDLDQPLVPRVRIVGWWQRVEYEGLRLLCFHCGRFGNSFKGCAMKSTEPEVVLVDQVPKMVASKVDHENKAESSKFGPWMVAKKIYRRRKPRIIKTRKNLFLSLWKPKLQCKQWKKIAIGGIKIATSKSVEMYKKVAMNKDRNELAIMATKEGKEENANTTKGAVMHSLHVLATVPNKTTYSTCDIGGDNGKVGVGINGKAREKNPLKKNEENLNMMDLEYVSNYEMGAIDAVKNPSRIVKISLTKDFVKYPGTPMIHGRITRATHSELINKTKLRLESWSNKYLSMAGQISLVKLVLSAMATYLMQMTFLPKHVVKGD
ncbi:Uncharacterized protein TCM_009467 [Theobroma cacao]|uniref:Uncharacterized protein n=1 Tax=Theobroma cacao TaxID=3641 RepID=A0A061E4Z6_THECC|nr:Uncharacterized protein TCM_009467 [Theobroma cacao]